jgi:hypothetical protein
MSVWLTGSTTGRPQGERVPINIDVRTRARLRNLLMLPQMRGVGWSEFIERAISSAVSELADVHGFPIHEDDLGERSDTR